MSSESDGEGYTKVYSGTDYECDGDYSDDDVDQCTGEGDNLPERCVYAVRRGASAKNCIFLYWDDCAAQIENCEEAEYEIFTLFEDASLYLTSQAYGNLEKAKRRRRKRKSEDDDDNRKTNSEELLERKLPPKFDKRQQRWDTMFAALKEYREAHGHTLVPSGSKGECTKKLSSWVQNQRRLYKAFQNGKTSSLTKDKVSQLTALGFVFTNTSEARKSVLAASDADISISPCIPSGRREEKWEAMYAELEEYKDKNGHCLVPQSRDKTASPDEISCSDSHSTRLSRWVHTQRVAYNRMEQGLKTTMTKERLARLVELGFVFKNVKAARRDCDGQSKTKWDERFEELRAFSEKNGHINLSMKNPDLLQLYRWTAAQRQHYKLLKEGKPNSLTAERLMKLNEISFSLTAKRGRKKATKPESNAATKLVGKKKKEDFGGRSWDEWFMDLCEYSRLNGTTKVPTVPYTKLGGWIKKQRREYKKIKDNKPSLLTTGQIARLASIGFDFPLKEHMKWEDRFKELEEFKETHGHCLVPRSHSDLGQWVQKVARNMALPPEHEQKLSDLGFVWQVIKTPNRSGETKSWQERFEDLLKFKEINGHTIVPQHYPGLGMWVHAQRVSYKRMKQGRKSIMNTEKALKLTQAGFVFVVKARRNRPENAGTYEEAQLERAAARAASVERRASGLGNEGGESDLEEHTQDMEVTNARFGLQRNELLSRRSKFVLPISHTPRYY
eukprot:CAMPEP_0113573756 /NCGR_PEP_ID=MMETSP0015_2-20120614/26791_1 /TAXON_ID=2838 /ORGANISM="Odontella" /LENGTH=727 /DNA_ID=CAMNT_0000476863 /DNA_START=427 /DNA_END=2609 /DNA_ORIENTATION=- /assembly_acc=CAM_ASM_000160